MMLIASLVATAGLIVTGGGSATFASTPPAEVRCVALAAWGEHHTKDVKVAITMNKMGLFFLGVLADKYPDQHWGSRIIDVEKSDTSPLAEKTKMIQGCVSRMQPYLTDRSISGAKVT